MLVGHQEVIGTLSSQLPPVSIITGPPSVGKRLIAAHAAMSNNIARTDFTEVSKLTVGESQRIKDFMLTKPNSKYKFALIDLDSASIPAVQDLLKTLEEPPEYARFSIISSTGLPATVRTRGYRYCVGLLNPEDLSVILRSKGVPENEALRLSHIGRVDLALKAYFDVTARTTTLNVLQAVLSGDPILFSTAYKAVDDNVVSMILIALEESAAQKWIVFNPEYLGQFSNRQVALKVLSVWSTIASARPQLSMRVALESVMRG